MTEKPYLGMIGYKAKDYKESGPPFMAFDVDVDDAKEIASENDLSEFFLVPRQDGYKHLGYIRVEPGKYKTTFTRIAVFRHLLSNDIDWIPTDEELETGDKLDRSTPDPES
jgi:hypothetical protein